VIDLKRRLPSEKVESFRLDRTAHLDVLARKAARWATDNSEKIRDTDPQMPAGLFNRDADNWRPLLAIAEAAGDKWPERAREAATLCCGISRAEDASQLETLLGDIRDVFEAEQVTEIASAALVDGLTAIEGHPWAEMGKTRKPLTQNRLARMLNVPGIGIGPEKVGPETKRLRGYRRERFEDAFARYLGGERGSKVDNRPEAHETSTSDDFQSGQPNSDVHFENARKPSNGSAMSGCPVSEGGMAGPKEWTPMKNGKFMQQLETIMANDGDHCSLCHAPFKANEGTYGGISQTGVVALVGDCCLDKLREAHTFGIYVSTGSSS
jgi:hypothetical protein